MSMAEKKKIPCPLCDTFDQYTILYEPWNEEKSTKRIYGAASGIPGTQTIVKCSACNLIFENPRYPEEVILEGYASSTEMDHDSQYDMRVISFLRALKRMKKWLPPQGSKVLDVGTAGGGFLEAAARFGYDAIGIEPSQSLVKKGKERGLRVEQGILDECRYPANSFDLICMWDVLEHLPRPKDALLKTRHYLKSDGILLINYPDIGTWQAKLAGRYFWWLISVHLTYFSRQTIMDMCERAGYNLFKFKNHWQTLQLGYLQDLATQYQIPLSQLVKTITPQVIKKLPVPYYASQTTVLAMTKR